MKLTSLLLLVLLITPGLDAQTLTAEFYPENEASSLSQFPLQNGVLNTSGDSYRFGTENTVSFVNPISVSISENRQLVASLRFSGRVESTVYSDEGGVLQLTRLENISSTDETVDLTLLNSGEFVIRDNVANFSFFGADGSRTSTYSNSAGASGGEQTSQISVSDDGVVKVVYNPVIQYQNGQGSRISLITGDNEGTEIYSSFERVILDLSLSESDHTISVITQDAGGSRSLHWFDRFGNLLFEMSSDMEIDGFSMSDNGEFVTFSAGNRVQVYNTRTSERLGSASSRSAIAEAAYFPDRNLILILGGDLSGQEIGNPDITAVDLQQRQIERVRLSESVMYRDLSDVSISHEGGSSFSIVGINRPIRVTAQF